MEMYRKYDEGFVVVITGCMFAGTTEELIRRIKIFEFAKKDVMVFKPRIDNRYSEDKVVSHAGSSVSSYVVDKASEILDIVKDHQAVIAVDEVQFFDDEICEVANELADRGYRVILAGLDTDFRGEPFGPCLS